MDFQKVSGVKSYDELLNSLKSQFLSEKNELHLA